MNEVDKYVVKCPTCNGPCEKASAFVKAAQAKVTSVVNSKQKGK